MKLLYIISATQVTGGGSKSFLNMLYGVMRLGVEPMVVCPDEGQMYQDLKAKGIPVATMFCRFSTYPPTLTLKDKLMFLPRFCGRLLANWIGFHQVSAIAQQFKPDIIHTNVSVINIGYKVAQHLHIPHIWHIREYGDIDFDLHYYSSKQKQITRYHAPQSYTICITKDIQRHHCLQQYVNSRVIYNGVLSNDAITYFSKKPYLLFVGRIQPAKGTLPLLKAYAEYCKVCPNPLPLHIAGQISDVAYAEVCRKVIKENALQDKVTYLGEIRDILPLYQEAQTLIVPSISEGFGRITAEAMFQGCLVVGNNTAGTKEQFDNGLECTGQEIALRYTTQNQLVQCLWDITCAVEHATFEQEYKPMILRAQDTIKQLYTTETHAKRVFEFYQSIIIAKKHSL
ncbi:MAG: glycosyltransferase [Paludibacteraceae bacterium]